MTINSATPNMLWFLEISCHEPLHMDEELQQLYKLERNYPRTLVRFHRLAMQETAWSSGTTQLLTRDHKSAYGIVVPTGLEYRSDYTKWHGSPLNLTGSDHC